MSAPAPHIPVMLTEVVEALSPTDGKTYVDGTFGAGGYTTAILEAANTDVVAIDRDPEAIGRGAPLLARFGDRLTLIEGCFGDLDTLVGDRGVDTVAGVALDLGVSSPQLDQAERGFSFRADGPLDMRMGGDGPTAADVVNETPEGELADIIFHLGEERRARRVAKAIVLARTREAITRTVQLAEIVRGVVPAGRDGIDPATRTFQALRIHVNAELDELDRGLLAAERLLGEGGRLAVVSFHSLEDRRVKAFLRARTGHAPGASRHSPAAIVSDRRAPSFRDVAGSRPIKPSAAETTRNPRSRSARLRVAERTAAPVWDEDPSFAGGPR